VTALELKNEYPSYFMSKQKLQLNDDLNFEAIQEFLMHKYSFEKVDTVDGLKIDFKDSWVQLRKSNTEPIIRIYSEAKSQESAETLANSVIKDITNKFL
jgi:phosphomannomutase